jgi:hypothetical protein
LLEEPKSGDFSVPPLQKNRQLMSCNFHQHRRNGATSTDTVESCFPESGARKRCATYNFSTVQVESIGFSTLLPENSTFHNRLPWIVIAHDVPPAP